MGIEIPESVRRQRRAVLPRGARRRRALARRSVGRRARRRAEHARRQRDHPMGAAPIRRRDSCRGWRRTASAPMPSRKQAPAATRSRCRRGRAKTATAIVIDGRKLWITNANEADIFIVFATVNPEAGYRGITAFVVERGTAGFTVGKKEDKLGIRASSTCELLFESCRRPQGQRPRRGRQGLQSGDRDAERRADRHRRADARALPPARSITRSATPKNASSSAKRSRIFRAFSSSSRAPRLKSRPPDSSSTTPRACATSTSHS